MRRMRSPIDVWLAEQDSRSARPGPPPPYDLLEDCSIERVAACGGMPVVTARALLLSDDWQHNGGLRVTINVQTRVAFHAEYGFAEAGRAVSIERFDLLPMVVWMHPTDGNQTEMPASLQRLVDLVLADSRVTSLF